MPWNEGGCSQPPGSGLEPANLANVPRHGCQVVGHVALEIMGRDIALSLIHI